MSAALAQTPTHAPAQLELTFTPRAQTKKLTGAALLKDMELARSYLRTRPDDFDALVRRGYDDLGYCRVEVRLDCKQARVLYRVDGKYAVDSICVAAYVLFTYW